MKSIRWYLLDHEKEVNDVILSKAFKTNLGEILGEKAKRLDKELQEGLKTMPILANKQFFYMASIPIQDHFDDNKLSETIMKYFTIARPFTDLLLEALDTN